MDDFSVDELIALYVLLDTRIKEFIDLLDSGELDAASRNKVLQRNSLYNGIKRKLIKKLKASGVNGAVLTKEIF